MTLQRACAFGHLCFFSLSFAFLVLDMFLCLSNGFSVLSLSFLFFFHENVLSFLSLSLTPFCFSFPVPCEFLSFSFFHPHDCCSFLSVFLLSCLLALLVCLLSATRKAPETRENLMSRSLALFAKSNKRRDECICGQCTPLSLLTNFRTFLEQ